MRQSDGRSKLISPRIFKDEAAEAEAGQQVDRMLAPNETDGAEGKHG